MMWRFAVPLSYSLHTRLRSPRGVLARLLYELVPQLVILGTLAAALHPRLTPRQALSIAGLFLVAWVSFMSFYELGYVHNDRVAPRERRA